MRTLVLAGLVGGALLVFAAPVLATGPTTLSRTGWQITRPYSPVFTTYFPNHGNPGFYGFIPGPIPGENAAGWSNCGPTNALCKNADTISMNMPNGSRLGGYPCLGSADFTFFQSLVSIPEGTVITQFSVNMNGADDGARVSIYNSLYPGGFIFAGSYIALSGGTGSTTDLSPYMIAGEVNRVLITQVDDCAVGNNLQFAQISLNGTVVPPAPADTTPPSSSPVVSPAANGAGWRNSDATVAWNWTDGGSGIDPANCTQSSTSAGEGAITLTSTCRDVAGNSASDSRTVNVDKTAPTVAFSGNAGTYSIDQSVSISCSSSDALSGIASDSCAGASGPAWSFGLGSHTLSASATDNAGNTGSSTTSFTVTVDATGLCTLVQRFVANAGIANSLCVKLRAAAAAAARGQAKTQANNLDAFVNEVRAQTGKALTAARAALLVELARAL